MKVMNSKPSSKLFSPSMNISVFFSINPLSKNEYYLRL